MQTHLRVLQQRVNEKKQQLAFGVTFSKSFNTYFKNIATIKLNKLLLKENYTTFPTSQTELKCVFIYSWAFKKYSFYYMPFNGKRIHDTFNFIMCKQQHMQVCAGGV